MPQGCGSMWPVGPPRATSECNKGDVAFLHSIDYRFNSIGIVLLVPSVLHFFLYYSYATPPPSRIPQDHLRDPLGLLDECSANSFILTVNKIR